jgi:hypothetical protein
MKLASDNTFGNNGHTFVHATDEIRAIRWTLIGKDKGNGV